MPRNRPIDSAAVAYARSVLELASEHGTEHEVGQELAALAELVSDNPALEQYFRDPTVSPDARDALITRAFAGQVSPLVLNLLRVMNDKGRLGLLRETCHAYAAVLDEKLGKVDVEVTVPAALDGRELEQVRELVGRALGKRPVVTQQVDDQMIGGIILRVGDTLIDASVRRQLQLVRSRLLRAGRVDGTATAR